MRCWIEARRARNTRRRRADYESLPEKLEDPLNRGATCPEVDSEGPNGCINFDYFEPRVALEPEAIPLEVHDGANLVEHWQDASLSAGDGPSSLEWRVGLG
jgi:hypothetical protein